MSKVWGWFSLGAAHEVNTDGLPGDIQFRNPGAFTRDAYIKKSGFGLCSAKYRGQPHSAYIHEPSSGVHMFIHGEIYSRNIFHDKDSRKEISELYEMFLKKGAKIFYEMNGAFTVIVYDAARKEVNFITDRASLRKIYYRYSKGVVEFSSELQPLLREGVRAAANVSTVANILTFGYPLGRKTIISDIEVTGPAEVVSFSEAGKEACRYWDWNFSEQKNNHCEEEYYSLLEDSVFQCVHSASNVTVPLSGGLDSRVLATMSKRAGKDVTAWNFGDKRCSDVRIAQKVAHELSVDYKHFSFSDDFIYEHLGETFDAFNGMIPLEQGMHFVLCENKKGEVPVLLHGHMGDVIAGSHFTIYNRMAAMAKQAVPVWGPLDQFVHWPVTHKETKWLLNNFCRRFRSDDSNTLRFFRSDLATLVEGSVDRLLEHVDVGSYSSLQGMAYYLNITQRQNRWIASIVDLLSDYYIVRCPFASVDLYQFASRMAPACLINQMAYKRMIRKFMPEISEIPTAKGPMISSRVGLQYHFWCQRIRNKVSSITGACLSSDANRYIDYDEQVNSVYEDYYRLLKEHEDTLSLWFNPEEVYLLLEDIHQGRDIEQRLSRRFFAILTILFAQIRYF